MSSRIFLYALLPLLLAGTGPGLFEKARNCEAAGDWAGAEMAYRGFLQTAPASAEAWSNLGVVLARQKRFEAAIEAYRKALRIRPGLAPVHLDLGLAYYKTGNRSAAIREFRLNLQNDRSNRQARQLLATSLLESDQYAEAAQLFESLRPTEDFSVRFGLATAYARLGRSNEARTLFDRLLSDDSSAEVQLALGQAYLAINGFEEAEKAFRNVAVRSPSMPGLHFFLGAVRWKQQDEEGAIEEWRAELAANPHSFEALFALGAVLADKGDSKEAEALLVRAKRGRPNHAPTLYYLGKLAWKQKRIEALALLGRSVQIESGNRQAHYLLSRIYIALGRKADASRELEIVRHLASSAVQEDIDIVAGAR